MIWSAPTEKNSAVTTLEKRVWSCPHRFRANSGHKARQTAAPISFSSFLRVAGDLVNLEYQLTLPIRR